MTTNDIMAETKKKLENPFVHEGYEGPDYFCDRTEETEKAISYLENGVNITLVSPRKIGKTGLIKHIFHHISAKNKETICLYIDIFSTKNQHEFVQLLGQAVVQEVVNSSKSAFQRALERISWLKPTISVDPLTGTPNFSVSIEPSHSEISIQNIFKYLNDSKHEVFIAIDEFQTIVDYPEKGTEALLRSYIQFLSNVHFIFSGSKQHLMYEMFGSPKRPFYQSTAMMSLAPLHEEIYYTFAEDLLRARNGHIEQSLFHDLYQRFDGWTWYMQSVLNRLFLLSRNVTDGSQITEALLSILADRGAQYESFITLLSDNQLKLLKAIASEGRVEQPTSNEFIKKHDLPAASSAKSALTFLLDHELVYRDGTAYIVYDRFMQLWLKRLFG
ncbi:MAG: ATP-binding protein [Prevotella sp.]|nr:ATP-binding protein [Prevotella sp.]